MAHVIVNVDKAGRDVELGDIHYFSGLISDPAVIGLHISPKGRGGEVPIAGSLYAWATGRFGA